jgi:hypothetical protein
VPNPKSAAVVSTAVFTAGPSAWAGRADVVMAKAPDDTIVASSKLAVRVRLRDLRE